MAGPLTIAALRRFGAALLCLTFLSELAGATDVPAAQFRDADAGTIPTGTAKAGRAQDARHDGAVTIFNRRIVTFRAPFLGVSARERAIIAKDRVAAALDRGGPGKVTVEKLDPGDAIKVDGALAFVLTRNDVDKLGGETLESLGAEAVRALEQAIAETREARSARLIVASALWAAGATVVYGCLLWVLRVLGRALSRRMLALAAEKAAQLKVGGTEVLNRERLVLIVRRILQAGFWALLLLLTYEWIGFVLGRFPYTRPWGEQLSAFLVDTVVNLLTAMAAAVPDLLVAVAIFFVARGVTGLMAGFFDGVQSGRVQLPWLDRDSARPTRRLAAFAV
jgi:hypothetical protein